MDAELRLLKKLLRPGQIGKQKGWLIRAVEFLVSRGHRFDDVVNRYTMQQVREFSEAGRQNRLVDMLDSSIAVRAAAGNERSWKKYVDSIKGITEPEKPREVRVVGKEQADVLRKLLSGKSVRVN